MYKACRILLLAVVISLGWATDGHADLRDAVDALQRGDYANGMPLLQEDAENGDTYAQILMGQFLTNGKAGKTDLNQAAVWYQQAAKKDPKDSPYVPIAQHNLASLYWNGRGVTKNIGKAEELYNQAAMNGYAESQGVLVGLYYRGEGVKKDIVQALKWAIVLAKKGNPNHQRGFELIKREATSEQYAKAQKEAENLVQATGQTDRAALGARRKPAPEKSNQNRAASPQQKRYDLTLELPDGFQLAFKDVKEAHKIYQYVPEGETVKNWEQMITVTVSKLNQPVPNIAELLVQNTLSGYQAQCRSTNRLSVSLPPTNLPSASGAAFCDDVDLSKIPAHIYVRKNGFIFVKAFGSPEAVYSFQYEWQSDSEPSSFVETSGLLKDIVLPMMKKSNVKAATEANQPVAQSKKPPMHRNQLKSKALADLRDAWSKMNSGDHDSAFKLAEAAVQTNTLPKVRLANAYILIGRVYRMRGLAEQAALAFTKSINNEPSASLFALRGDAKYCVVKKLSDSFAIWNADLNGKLDSVMGDYESSKRMMMSSPGHLGATSSFKLHALQTGRKKFLKDRGAEFESNYHIQCPGVKLSTADIALINRSWDNKDIGNVKVEQLWDVIEAKGHIKDEKYRKEAFEELNRRGVDLSHITLPGQGGELRQLNLKGAKLEKATLQRTSFKEANFSEANLQEADISLTNLSFVDFRGANLSGARLNKARADGTDFSYAQLNGAVLDGLWGEDIQFSNASLKDVDLFEAKLTNSNFRSADLTNGDLRDTKLGGVNFKNANLTNVRLNRAFAVGVSFEGANMAGVKFKRTNISNSIFGQNNTVTQEMIDRACYKPNWGVPKLPNGINPPPLCE